MDTLTRRRSLCVKLPVALILFTGGIAAAENVDPAGDGSQYAWGENIGWLNAEPQGDGGPGIQVTDTELTGWLWAGNLGWISLSCQNTSTCDSNAYGVANDGKGNLSGLAWGEHLGWIDFRRSDGSDCCIDNGTPGCNDSVCEASVCASEPTCCNDNWHSTCAGLASAESACLANCAEEPVFGVRIHGLTGAFSGLAWSEHHGWIDFGTAPIAESFQVETAWTCPDPDSDGVCTASDNCSSWSNPDQGAVLFEPTTLVGSNKIDLEWALPVDWEVARGTFTTSASIGSYSRDFIASGFGTVYSAAGFPDSGFGYWYIFRPNCPAGSYATGTVAEQGNRDGALIP